MPVVIRPMGGRDLAGLIRLRGGGTRLDQPDTQIGGYTPLIGLTQGNWNPLRSYRVRTYVASVARAPVAFIQARERSSQQRHKWDIVYLGTASGTAAATAERRIDLWTALLDYTTVAAGRRGVQRLYAKLPGSGDVADAFRAAGYVRYGEEAIYLLHGHREGRSHRENHLHTHNESPLHSTSEEFVSRAQAPADTWALHQLYTLTAPKATQYAEAHTSHRWELSQATLLRGRGLPRESGLVVEREHEIVLYCRIGQQGNRTRLEFVFEPNARDWLAPALDVVLQRLAPGAGERVYCVVREFQEELGATLVEHGFTLAGVQETLVRYTTVSVHAPALGFAGRPSRERRLVGVPAGSLHRQPLPGTGADVIDSLQATGAPRAD